jgi:phenylacetate-CoA ligase
LEPAFLAEVVNPESGRPVEQGEEGELVLTTLGRTASPVLRYRTGDLVRLAADPVCRCGRAEVALEGGVLGRSDDMVVIRGVNIHPSAIEDILRGFPLLAEYRVTVKTDSSLSEIHVEVEPSPTCADPMALCAEIETGLRTVFNLRIPVTFVTNLPRFELKARRWIRTEH